MFFSIETPLSANDFLFVDRVSANKNLFEDTIYANKKLFADCGVQIEKKKHVKGGGLLYGGYLLILYMQIKNYLQIFVL